MLAALLFVVLGAVLLASLASKESPGFRFVTVVWGLMTWLFALSGAMLAGMVSPGLPLGVVCISGFVAGTALVVAAFVPSLRKWVGQYSMGHHIAVATVFTVLTATADVDVGMLAFVLAACLVGSTHAWALAARFQPSPRPVPAAF